MKRYIGQDLGRFQASVPVELGCITLSAHGCVYPPGSSPNFRLLGFCGGFLMEALIINSISIPSPPSPEWEDRAENSKLLITVFIVSRPTQEPTRNPPRVTSLEQKTLLSPRKYQGASDPYVRNLDQRSNIRTKDAPYALITGNYRGLETLCKEPGAETNIYFFCYFLPLHT